MSVESVDAPVTVEALTPSAATMCPAHDHSVDAAGSAVGDRFEEVAGSKFVAMFAPALFDEMMHPAVSASLVDTARIRDNPLARARRTAASDQLAFFARSADRAEEMQRLVELHRDVKGVQPDGVRYSAMSPNRGIGIFTASFLCTAVSSSRSPGRSSPRRRTRRSGTGIEQ